MRRLKSWLFAMFGVSGIAWRSYPLVYISSVAYGITQFVPSRCAVLQDAMLIGVCTRGPGCIRSPIRGVRIA